MNRYLKKREELLTNAKSLISDREKANQSLSADDRARLKSWSEEIDDIDAKLDSFEKDAGLVAVVKGRGSQDQHDGLGEYKVIRPATARGVADQLAKSVRPAPDGEKAMSLTGGTSELMVELAGLPEVPQGLLSVIPQRKLDSPPTYRYLRQSVRTNNAAPVAAGDEKPVSPLSLTPHDGRLRVVAHMSDPIDKYLLLDVNELGNFLEAELRYGLFASLENQVLNGSGTGENLTGLLNTSGVLTQTAGADLLGTLRSSITKVENGGFVPATFVLSPADWEVAETATTSGSGEFQFASSPVDRAARRVWGVPVAVSTAVPAGKGVLLSQNTCWLATDGKVDVELDKSKGFATNEVEVRVEGRWDLAVTRPTGIVSIATA